MKAKTAQGPAPTALEIADSLEAHARKLQWLADILRGKM